MPPKRDKSRAGGSSRFAGDQGLANVPFNEEGKWNACLALVVGNRVEDLAHVEALTSAVKGGRRKLFTSLSREDLYTLVNEFGTSKSSLKGKDVPQFSEICEPCKQHLENEEEIPLPLLARLIKFKLLDIKSQDIKRREAEKKALDERVKSSKGKSDKKEASRSPAKTGRNATGKGKPVESSVTKAASKLKKRGEEDLTAKYINDEPDDGPEHYIIISGFYHPHLMTYLTEIGVNIDAVININSQTYNSSGKLSCVVLTDDAVGAASVSDDDELKRKEKEKTSMELRKFWQDVLLIMDKAPENSSLHDVARLEYMVPDFAVPYVTDVEAKATFGAMVFEVVACLMYNLLDAKRQWRNYLDNLQLVHVPHVRTAEGHEFAETGFASPVVSQSQTKLESALDFDGNPAFEVDMKRYNELMNCIPLESVGIPLIMHCMLEQISAYDQQLNANREASDDEKPGGLENCLSQHLSSMAFKLALTAEERKVLFPDYNPPLSRAVNTEEMQPLLIHFHDDITRRLNHLNPVGSFNPVEAELQMLGYSRASKLTSRVLSDSDGRMAQERAAHLQELLFFCNKQGIYSKSDVGHALRQFVLECMNLTVVDEDGRIYNPRGQQTDIPWDDPYPYYVGMIPTEKSPRVNSCKESTESLCQDQDLVIESSREQLSSSGSILKRPESRNSRKRASSCQSVRFEDDDSGQRTSRPGDENPEEENECSENSGSNNRNSSLSSDSKGQSVDASEVVNDNSKRNLDNWQYAEHMEPKILLQALAEALQTHPCVDTYYQKRDDTLLVVFHNPHNPEISNSFNDWHIALHSNVRFRNYLEFVADRIVEWTQSEEAKYEAHLLAQEVQRLQKEDENQMTPVDKNRPARSKSPKKAGTPDNRTPRSPSSSIERETPYGSYIRAGSLKAWKEEQARLKEEEEEREQLAEEKRVKSSQKKLEKDVAPDNPKSKGKDKEKGGKKQLDSKADEKSELISQELTTAPEKYWPFTGYDVGNKLVHLAGITSTLFPDDGSQILTERIQYLHGTTSVRATVRKSGHSFAVHVIDPKPMIEAINEVEKTASPEVASVEKKEEEGVVDGTFETACREKLEMDENVTEGHSRAVGTSQSIEHIGVASSREKHQQDNPAIGRFGSFTAQFSDGMTLSMSCFGPAGEPPNGKPYVLDPYTVAMNAPTTGGSGTEREASPGRRTKTAEKTNKEKDKPNQAEVLQAPKENETEEVTEDVLALSEPFQQLYVACPDGLRVTYALESSFGANSVSDKKQIVVKQSYPFKVKSPQKCEGARKTAMQEQSRMISSDGTVIKTMLDGSAKVLFADGTVSEFCFSSSLIPAPLTNIPDPHQIVRDSVSSAAKKKTKHRSLKGNQQGSGTSPEENNPHDKGFWITTLPSGKRTANHVNGPSVKVPDAVICVATDPQTHQVMHTRDDHVVTVHHPDGLTIVEHSDGTRITTKRQEIVQEVSEKNTDNDRKKSIEQVIEACVVRNKDGVELDQEVLLPEAKDHAEKDIESDSNEDLKRETEKSSTAKKLLTTRFVLVECPGYASVRFDEASGLCSCEFGNGCIVDCMTEGRYDIFHQTGSCLRLDSDGTAVFYDERKSCAPRAGHEPQYYVMRHFDGVIAETIDGRGAHYIVTNFGENHVNLPNTESEIRGGSTEVEPEQRPHSAQSSGVGLGQEQNITKKNDVIPVPRMFAINNDGSGVELLHSDDISSYLSKVEKDPASVVLTAPLPDCTDVYGITVLRPVLKNMSQSWMKGYLSDSIIPAGLRSRDLQRVSPGEVKIQDPTRIEGSGRCALTNAGSVQIQSKKKVKCARILEFRQLIKRNSVSDTLRNQLISALKSYADHVKKRAAFYNGISIVETQSDADKEPAEAYQAQLSFRCATPRTLASDQDVKSIYEKALTPVERPKITASAKARKKKYDLELVRQELAEEKECLLALRLRNISPYFKSNLSCSYFNRQDKTKKVNLQKQFVGYMACGESLKADEMESSENSHPPPGMVCQHVSPEPDRHKEVEIKSEKAADYQLPNTDDKLVAVTTECSLQEERQPTDDKAVNLSGRSAEEHLISNVCLATKELISTNTLQDSENSRADGKNPKETEESLNESHLESRPSSCVQSNAGLLEDHNATDAPVVNDSAEEMSGPLETLNSHRRLECDDFKLLNMTPWYVAEEPVAVISKDDTFLVTPGSEDMQNYHRCSQQIGYDQLTVHMDHNNDGNLCQGEAVVEKSENSKLGANISYLIRRTQAECSLRDTPCIPGCISNGKRPGAFPNKKFACIEDPIRRKVNNVIITGATPAGFQAINRMRGLEMVPERVDFGILKEGNTYTYNLILKNTGVDACRFRIKQPPPSTGVKILYQPGPVAAGLKTDVLVEIYAIAVGVEGDRGVGLIAHNVEITTETDHMLLPVTATVLTASEFDCRGPDSPQGQKAPGVRLISSKPPAGVGLIRPRKTLMHGGYVTVN